MNDVDVPLEQLDAWEQALTSGNDLLQQAVSLQQQAENDAASHRWRLAADKFRLARETYTSAATRLADPASIGETSMRAVRVLRDESQTALKQSQSALQLLATGRQIERCETYMREAVELLQESRAALGENNFANARTLASQAREKDPELHEQAQELIYAADEAEASQPSYLRWLVLAVIFVVLGTIVVLFGQPIWSQLNEFFFPASAVLFLVQR